MFKHTFCNPPYQLEVGSVSDQQQPTVVNIFQEFQNLGLMISDSTSMIYPAGRWMQKSGKRVQNISEEWLNNPRFAQLDFYRNGDEVHASEKVFPTMRINDGVSIVRFQGRQDSFLYNGLEVKKPFNNLLPLDENYVKIVEKFENCRTVNDTRSPVNPFKIGSDMVEKNPDKFVLADSDTPPPHIIEPVKVLTNNIGGKNGRPHWYWMSRRDVPRKSPLLDEYNFAIKSAIFVNETHQLERGVIIRAGECFGRSKISLHSFPTFEECDNFRKYMQTELVSNLFFQSLAGGAKYLGCFVPVLEDYSNDNPLFQSDEELGEKHEYFGKTLNERIAIFLSEIT